jgi:hypothetical protein
MLAKLSTVEYSTRIRAARSARAHIIAIEQSRRNVPAELD